MRAKTPKQRKFFKNIIAGHSNRQSAIRAGYSEATAHKSAKNNTERYQDDYREIIDRMGGTDEKIIKTVVEILDANEVVGYLNNRIRGIQKVSDEFVEVPNVTARLKAADILLKLKNAYPATKHEVAGKGGDPIEVKVVYA